jgi:hypothetical protein
VSDEEDEMAEPMLPEELERHARILNESDDRGALASSAVALAASEDASAVLVLARHLGQGAFLARLDDVSNPASDMDNLLEVFRALAEHPTPATGRVCEQLYAAPDFRENPSRTNLLLVALAAVRPTTAEGAEIFRASSLDEYAGVNGPLLVQNESPLALQVFEELMALDSLDVETKVDILHQSVLPKRISLPVVRTCANLMDRELPSEVKDGIVETLFDYQSRLWFGPARTPPTPPSWELATTEALDFLIALAARHPAAAATRDQLELIRRGRESPP